MKTLRVSIAIAFAVLPACAGTSVQSGARSAPSAAGAAPASGAAGATASNPAAPAMAANGSGMVAPDHPTGTAAARDAELARQAATIFGVFSNDAVVFSRDGKRIVFASDREGLPQMFVADAAHPDAPAMRLEQRSERVGLGRPTPDGKAVLFRSDHGADENWSIFRIGLDGKDVVELTTGEKLNRDPPLVPEKAPDKLFFSARTMNSAATLVYAASTRAAMQPRTVFHDDKPGNLVDVSPNGRHGLFVRHESTSDTTLYLVDLAAGTARLVYPQSGKVSISDAGFSADGSRILVATDGGSDQALLLSFDRTGKELARYVENDPPAAVLSDVLVSRHGDLLALSVNAGNHSEVRLLDAKTLKPRAHVAMPLGSGRVRDFTQDGRHLALSWSTPGQPTDLYSVDTRSGRLSPLRKEARPQLASLPPIESTIAQVKAFDGLSIPINVYLPAGAPGQRHPVIVSYHGGPAGASAIRWSAMTRFFLSQGYAWVEPNVRGSSGFGRSFEQGDDGHKRLDAFRDIETSARWAAAQPWADKDRVVVFGGSYGGYTVLVALTRWPDIWRAGVDLFGVANLKTFMSTTSGFIRHVFLIEFGDPDKDAPFLDSISPLRDVGRIADPLFVYAGANDPRVPRSESDLIVKAVRARGVPVEYMVKDNEGHSLAHRENQIEFCARAARFLETHLRSPAASR